MNKMKVNLDRKIGNSYEIHIGEEILDRMGMILARNNWAERYVIVTDTRIDALHGERVQQALEKTDLRVERITVPPGEAAKEIETVLAVTEKLIALGADRQTALIALGGGVIGDLTGFRGLDLHAGDPRDPGPDDPPRPGGQQHRRENRRGHRLPGRTSSGPSTSRRGSSSTSPSCRRSPTSSSAAASPR